MSLQLVFETHSLSEDNNSGIATGWNHSRLSTQGRALAIELGKRRRDDGIQAVFTSDLGRAIETAQVAFADTGIPILADWRLRECDYGQLNGQPADQLHKDRGRYLDEPYPKGENWQQAVERVGSVLPDLSRYCDMRQWNRVLIIGHVATRWALDHYLNGKTIEALMKADFAWKEGWEYQLGDSECHLPNRPVEKFRFKN